MADLKFPIEYTDHVVIETDGTAPGTIVTVVSIGNARIALSCVVAFEGGGERLEVPGLDPADPEIITLKVRGLVRRVPTKEYQPPFDDGGLLTTGATPPAGSA
jgi:hypothetical protein